MTSKIKIVFFFLFIVIFLFGVNFVSALETSGTPSLPEYAKSFFNWGMGIAGSLAVLVIIFGGLHYLISFGMGKIKSAGKEWIKAGIMGLLILLCAYLIVSTINPQLTYFHLGDIIPVSFIPGGNGPTPWTPPEPETIIYKEIPIGTLIENVLTRTIDCYEFDSYGEPIDGKSDTSRLEPGLMNHDRVDCLLKLAEAAERKAEIFKDLSDKIVDLMEGCDCSNSCEADCPECDYSERVDDPSKCDPSACDVEGQCKNKPGYDPCPEGTKEKIEHGPIYLNNKEYKGLDEFRTEHPNIINKVEKEIEIEEKKVRIIKKEVWEELKLIDKLRYLKTKIDKEKEKIEEDAGLLKAAESVLKECYLAKPYVDFLKIKEENKKEDKIIKKQEIFRDPYTDEYIDVSRYCKGFLYADSQCYQTCRNICPGTNKDDFSCYERCVSCDDEKDPERCLEEQKECMKGCFDESSCSGNSNFANFKDCLTGCRNRCLEVCQEKYLQESENREGEPENKAYGKCVEECNNDSQCFVEYTAGKKVRGGGVSINENQEKCYISLQSLKACADAYDNFENFEKCAKTSFKGKYCTDQHAGYPDCLKELGGEYSSSFLYENPEKQRCPDCYEEIDGISCVELYPETAKCPSCSSCPGCPCSIQDVQGNIVYRTCSGECGEFAYNDDPLTFYCRQDWREEKEEGKLMGQMGWRCEKNNEIPVGRTVDETEDWAKKIVKSIDDFVEKTEDMIKYIIKIGNEEDYCECESSCNGDEGACEPSCEYNEDKVEYEDPETGEMKSYWICYCVLLPCEGNPCQKVINLSKGKEADERCPEGVEYKGVEWYYNNDDEEGSVKEAFEEFEKFIITGERSEILKKLIYSRKKVDDCSKDILIMGERKTALLSCKRAWVEAIPSIPRVGVIINNKRLPTHCYGIRAGEILNIGPLADNWFCCEERGIK